MDENMNGNQQNGTNAGQPDGAAQNMNPNQQAYGGQQYYRSEPAGIWWTVWTAATG